MVTVKLEIPDEVADLAKQVARSTRRRVEEVLVEWLDRASNDIPVESLPDEQVIALCDLQMNNQEQEELGDLLDRNREGDLDGEGHERLEALMQVYRHGLVRKAEALRVAVQRGLREPLT